MGMYLGSTPIIGLRGGSNEIIRAFVGSSLVFGPPLWVPSYDGALALDHADFTTEGDTNQYFAVGAVRANAAAWLAAQDGAHTRSSAAYRRNASALQESVSSDVLRFNHSVAGALLGAWMEGPRTNLFPKFNQFDDANWAKTTATVSANSATAPDGNTTADKLIPNNSAAAGARATKAGVPGSTGLHIASVYAEAAGMTVKEMVLFSIENGSTTSAFNLSTGAVASGAGIISNEGSNRYRCALAKNFTGLTSAQVQLGRSTTTGNGTDGYNLSFAQFEAVETVAFASSVIATDTTALSRAADIMSHDVNYDAGAVAFDVEFDLAHNGQECTILHGADGATDVFELYTASGNLYLYHSAADESVLLGALIAGTNKAACRIDSTTATGSLNGAAVQTTAPGTARDLMTELWHGSYGGTAGHMFGHFRKRTGWQTLNNAGIVARAT